MTKNTISSFPGWIITFLALGSATGIFFITGFNIWFLVLQLLLVLLALFYGRSFNSNHQTVARIILGLLFLMSGFVKAVDPLGTAYKIEDYFIAYGTDWALDFSLILSVCLNTLELILGFLLLFNIKPRATSVVLILTMILFTLTTLNDAINNPVPDCGCFGDAIKLTNWQTFYKNLSIDIFVIVVAFCSGKRKYRIASVFDWISIPLALAGFVYFQIYCLNNLPVVEFTKWKEGKVLKSGKKLPVESYVIYQNKISGEKKEYLSPDFPWNDSVWMAEWQHIDTRIVDPNPVLHDLTIEDESGNTITELIIENPGYQLILVCWDINRIKDGETQKFRSTIDKAINDGVSFILLTSSLQADVDKFRIREKVTDWDAGFGDDTVLKTMIRSNPGLILLKDGKIIKKWHYRNIPGWDDLKKEYLSTT